jgi:hypothetical protein
MTLRALRLIAQDGIVIPSSQDVTAGIEVSANSSSIPIQLSLPLDRPGEMLFVNVSGLHGHGFREALGRHFPEIVLDLRAFPRFDFVSYSRKQAFVDFQSLDCAYLSRPLKFEIIEALAVEKLNEVALEIVVEAFSVRPKMKRPIMFLFEEEKTLQKFKVPLCEAYQAGIESTWQALEQA